jgi:hypothetical protein
VESLIAGWAEGGRGQLSVELTAGVLVLCHARHPVDVEGPARGQGHPVEALDASALRIHDVVRHAFVLVQTAQGTQLNGHDRQSAGQSVSKAGR